MFGISSGELFFIAIIALIVLGPERLPKATRFAGLWVRRARAQWHSVKDELEREMAADELKRNLQDARESLTDIERKVRQSHAETEREFEQLRSAVQSQPASAAEDQAAADVPAPAPVPVTSPLPTSAPADVEAPAIGEIESVAAPAPVQGDLLAFDSAPNPPPAEGPRQ